MTKEVFCDCMRRIKEDYDNHESVMDDMFKLTGGCSGKIALLSIETAVKILTEAMNDTEGNIEYFIYECSFGANGDKKVYQNGIEAPFKTYEDLYNFIVR